ncbi:MAG: hypothetical protein LBS56_00380, partial [Propionibacteriaceae bacterium]|nr:hypothetical protein [Propionibacteriaceae bacterium]
LKKWAHASAAGGSDGGSFTLSVDQNTGKARNATVKVKCGGLTAKVAVQQSGAPSLSLSKTSWLAAKKKVATKTITVTTSDNAQWRAALDPAACGWVTLSATSGVSGDKFMVTTQANTGGARACPVTVTLAGTSMTETLTIRQRKA